MKNILILSGKSSSGKDSILRKLVIAEDDEAFIDICKEFMIFMRNKDNKLFLGKIGENYEVV